MNTKTFAQQSRTLLMEGVANKLMYWGFNKDGSTSEEPNPVAGGYVFRGKVFDDETVPKLWESLHQAIKTKGVDIVKEEAAYIWFNRMMALQIMAKNDYLDAQLVYVQGMVNTPQILQKARQGQYAYLNSKEQERLKRIITDFSKEQEAFALLLVGYCHSNNMLNNVFGQLDDYTELLLPDNMLQDSGFLHLLNTTDAITDEQYKEVELIGWLYQFYISERKDEVFASFNKNKKAEAKDIPSATQIFTPNWIVKYMVQNTVGKIWLDKNPTSKIKSRLKYFVDNEIYSSSESIISEVSQLTLIDPAVGSGHILVEGFDLLYQMYMEEYYTPEEAVESILKNNLFGLDIDVRAVQLATFAILLKAAKHYRDVFAKGWLPNVYPMPEHATFSVQEIKDFLGSAGLAYEKELTSALILMEQAKNLGSVMKLNISEDARIFIEKRFAKIKNADFREFSTEIVYQKIKSFIPVLLLLSCKYKSVVANPPYLGPRNMNGSLKQYIDNNYPITKSDLFAVFIEVSLHILSDSGFTGIINQESWLFNSSYKSIRKKIIDNNTIISLMHLGTRTFDEVSGEKVRSVSFVLSKNKLKCNGIYFKLTDYNSSNEKKIAFLEKKSMFKDVDQINFHEIDGSPIAYWMTTKVLEIFKLNQNLSNYSSPRKGNSTSDNERFLRLWHEVNPDHCSYNSSSITISLENGGKWIPYNKGGGTKKWYGHNEYLIDWTDNGNPIREIPTAVVTNEKFYMKPGLTWSAISSKSFGIRYFNEGFIFDNNGCCLFDVEKNKDYLAALLNSKVFFFIIGQLNPALAFHPGDVKKFPIIFNEKISLWSLECFKISKKDWDSRETSWDFQKSILSTKSQSILDSFDIWKQNITNDFFQIHEYEEEHNRLFIEIYGLQDELTPEVGLKEITILQDELKKNDLEALEETFRTHGKEALELPIDRGEVISQFISYAIGLFMGRYRLDKPGLNIVHPNPTKEELSSYTYNNGEVIIDQDAILPIMGKNCNFNDDVVKQFTQLLDCIWGHEQRTENINFIQECLDKELEKFLVNDFWSYHCGMYKKTPIYWLFSSKKGAFQVLVYMHRMNEFTVEKIRANYLLEHLKYLKSEISQKEANASSLSTAEAKQLDKLRADLLECEQYDMALKNIADQQIKFDLDDGVANNYELFESVVAKIK